MTWLQTATRWTLESVMNLPLFIPVLVVAVVIAFSFDARSTPPSEPSAEEETVPTHAEAHAAAEDASGLPAGMLGDILDVHSVFLRCSNAMSVLTPPAQQRRCYGWGAAVVTYVSMRRDSLAEDFRNIERIATQRMEALGWKVGDELTFQPIGVR